MRSHKILLAGASLVATMTATTLSMADGPPPNQTPPTNDPIDLPPDMTTTPAPVTPPTTPPPTTPPTSTTQTTAADTDATALPAAPPPASTEKVEVTEKLRPNRPLLLIGGSLLLLTYGTTAAFVGANSNVADRDLYIPVVGPWINLTQRSCSGDCADFKRDSALIAVSGALQGVGLAMMITSVLVPEKTTHIAAGPVKMQLAPTASAGGGGLGAIGTF